MNEGGYEVEDLERMIAECERNVATLEKGIERERANIEHWQSIIEAEREKAAKQAAIDHVNESVMGLLKERLEEHEGDEPVVVRIAEVTGDCQS